MRAVRLFLAGSLTVAVGFVTAPSPVSADHGDNGSLYEIWDRDNNEHGRQGYNLTARGQDACDWGAARLENSEIDMHANDPSDVICRDAHYDASWFGLTTCENADNTEGRCDVYWLRFDLAGDPSVAAFEYIGCHEFGHTSSLGHRGNGNTCMNGGSGARFYDDHDLDSINADY